MYELKDTVVAVSSADSQQRVLVRITGPETVDVCGKVFSPAPKENKAGIFNGRVTVADALEIDAKLYLFLSPRSYTGEDTAELHIYSNNSVTEALMKKLFSLGLRMAGPGEFTARAYLNGKIDLAQAEAVNEIIVSSNKYQLQIAEKLLEGRLAESTKKIQNRIMKILTLLEAGMDFSEEDIEFVTRSQAIEALETVKASLEELLSGRITYERVIELPSVGIAGAVNAGKSSLLNALLGTPRSIISGERKTTRDVLTGILSLQHTDCVLFDCAGLIISTETILDELAQRAAIDALKWSSLVLFCVDISKENFSEDIAVRSLINPEQTIAIATKADLLTDDLCKGRLKKLNELFDADFLAISTKTNFALEILREMIDQKMIELKQGAGVKANLTDSGQSAMALTARHYHAITDSIDSISEAIDEFKSGNDEVTAMLLRTTYQSICDIEQQNVDEQILDNIFSNFCIGK